MQRFNFFSFLPVLEPMGENQTDWVIFSFSRWHRRLMRRNFVVIFRWRRHLFVSSADAIDGFLNHLCSCDLLFSNDAVDRWYDLDLQILPFVAVLGWWPWLNICFWAAAPKGTKSCRTQGDFCSSFRPFVRPFVPPRPSQAWNLPSQAWNLPSQAWNLPSQALNLPSQAWNLPFQTWNLPVRL